MTIARPGRDVLLLAGRLQVDARRVSELAVGSVATVVRMGERLDAAAGTPNELERAGVVRGVHVVVVGIGADGSVTVRGPRATLRLSAQAADDLFVVEGDLAQISDTVARAPAPHVMADVSATDQ